MSPSASDARSCHPASPGPPSKFKSFSAERLVVSFPRHRMSHPRAVDPGRGLMKRRKPLGGGRRASPAVMSGRGGPGFGGQDGAGECGDVVAAVMAAPVDEEGRGAGDATEVGGVYVLGDPRGAGPLAQVLTESLAVEPEVADVADQVARQEGVLVLQEQVVHLPERVLVRGGFRGFGGELGVRVDVV